MNSYNTQTINAPNPIARFAHRSRIKQSIHLALPFLKNGTVLDYGCGTGHFVAEMLKRRAGCAVGYEPYMDERCGKDLPIYREMIDVEKHMPFALVTLFETIEHLSLDEIDQFLLLCDRLLSTNGRILISAPIEVGPALLLKEMNRSLFRLKFPEHKPIEFVKATLFGIAARRAENIKVSHRGFDFRRSITYLKEKGWEVKVLTYGPLPIKTWYGNSQVYFLCYRGHR